MTRVRPAPISSSRRTVAWRSSPRTGCRAMAARRSIVRCCRWAARSSSRTPRAPTGPDFGCAGSFLRSTSTTGSRWRRKLGVSESLRQNPGLVLAGADFDVHQFDAMGARFTDLKLRMREAAEGMDIRYRWTRSRRHRELVRARRGRSERTDRRAARPNLGAGSRQRCLLAGQQGGRQRRAIGRPGSEPVARNRSCGGRADLEGPGSWPARVRRTAEGSRLEDRPLAPRQRSGAARSQRGMASCRAAAANETRNCPRREGSRCVPGAIRLSPTGSRGRRRGSKGNSDGPARPMNSTSTPSTGRSGSMSVRAASPSSNRARASCSACFRCRRSRDASRSTTATSSATVSRSTTSAATCGSRAASCRRRT